MATGSKEFLKEIDALLLETNIEEDTTGRQENTVSEIREENISNDNSKCVNSIFKIHKLILLIFKQDIINPFSFGKK